jgi:hypothetical protein
LNAAFSQAVCGEQGERCSTDRPSRQSDRHVDRLGGVQWRSLEVPNAVRNEDTIYGARCEPDGRNRSSSVLYECAYPAWPAVSSFPFNADLKGYGQGAEAVPARRLLIHLFHGLALQGWHLAASSDLTKKTMDKDTLFFRSGPPIQRVFFSVSFNETDKIRLIDSPNEPITTAFRQTVGVSTAPRLECMFCLSFRFVSFVLWRRSFALC